MDATGVHLPWTRSFDLSLLWTFVTRESEGAFESSISRGSTPSLSRSVWARRQLVSENATEDALNHKDTQSNSGAASLRL
jgi:hypothetical protein